MGKSNVLVKKVTDKATGVSVKTNYVVTKKIASQFGRYETSINFTTDTSGTFEANDNAQAGMTCYSKHTLEKAILDSIEKALD